ncbi:MAG TPA: cobalamin-independent methionine synthase II family protein [Steroidobacteraceae bacterium]|nr:cobalamin-independent methionine synthase II family protein [Steroidobacteraceae bacterium]
MQPVAKRVLTTHVGSLIRPPALVAMLRDADAGKTVDEAALGACLESSVADIVRAQSDLGLDIINDGEFGKTISWSRYVLTRMSGLERRAAPADPNAMPKGISGKDRRDFAEFYQAYDRTQGFTSMTGWTVVGPVKYTGQAAIARDIEDLQRALWGVPHAAAFMTAVAPASVLPDREDRHYRSDEEFLGAVADALHEEYRAIVDAGFILQVDDAYLATYYDIIVPPGSIEDYRRWAALRVEALNHALRGIPPERTRYHVCWGSWNGPHVSDVGFEEIADLVLKVNVGAYALEMGNPRHEHEWRVWENVKLPEGKVLIPGVISHSTNVVEHPKLVAERITRLARLVGRENVMAGTDCGFAQGPFVQRVHPSIMWAKLGALVEGARLATGELWTE